MLLKHTMITLYEKMNAANVLGLSCFQKVTAVFRMLTYGIPVDAADEYTRIGESTILESLRRFVAAVVDIFEDEYLRYPNEADTAHLLALGEQRGFPGMLGPSIVCIGSGRTVQYKNKVNTRGMWTSPLSFWRLLRRKTFGYGMPSLECLDLIMI